MADPEEPAVELVDPPVVATSDPGPAEPAPDPVPPKVRRSSPVGAILGGVIAAVIGFGVAQLVPAGWPLGDTSALDAKFAAQAAETVALKAQVAKLAEPAAVATDEALTNRVTALEASLAAQPSADSTELSDRLASLEQRLTAIESLPIDGTPASGAALAQLQSDIAALKSGGASSDALQQATKAIDAKLAEAQASITAIKSEAEATAKAAASRAAVQQIASALDSGASYASALTALPEDLPAILMDNAATGVPTLQDLRQSFPDAARAALEASLRANMGDSWTSRVSAFLANQTGARSLTPHEGSDPDAVLSRAEAALNAGDLATVLTELAALPPEGQAAMADWQALCAKRQDAISAVQSLSASMGK